MKHLALIFSIDYRSLRLCRLALGFLLIFQAVHYSLAIEPFFSEGGILPLELRLFERNCFSLLCLSTHPILPWLHTFALAAAGVALIYNWYPRLAAAVSFVVLVSFANRSEWIMYGADNLLRALVFWTIFLPAGPSEPGAKTFSNLASAVALLQIAVLYVVTGFLKSTETWIDEGLAVYLALQGELYTRQLAQNLSELPLWLLQLTSRAVCVWERFGPLLFFSPVYFTWARMLSFSGFAMMHLSFAATLYIGLFPLVDLVFLFLLLPSGFWDYFSQFRFSEKLPRLSVIPRVDWWDNKFAVPILVVAVSGIGLWALNKAPLGFRLPGEAKIFVKVLGFGQTWTMFAPEPFTEDGWFVVQGELQGSGFPVDLLKMEKGWADFRKPKVLVSHLPSERWISALLSIGWTREHEGYRLALVDYFCSQWNRRKPDPLESVKVWFVEEPTMRPGLPKVLNSHLVIAKDCLE